jgi:hypothetical protein
VAVAIERERHRAVPKALARELGRYAHAEHERGRGVAQIVHPHVIVPGVVEARQQRRPYSLLALVESTVTDTLLGLNHPLFVLAWVQPLAVACCLLVWAWRAANR